MVTASAIICLFQDSVTGTKVHQKTTNDAHKVKFSLKMANKWKERVDLFEDCHDNYTPEVVNVS